MQFLLAKAMFFPSIFSADTAPGTKVRLIGRILIENGMLVINGTNCQVLGGTVEKLAEKWNMEKAFFDLIDRL